MNNIKQSVKSVKSIEIINDYKLSDKDIDVIDNLILNKFSFKNFLKKLI